MALNSLLAHVSGQHSWLSHLFKMLLLLQCRTEPDLWLTSVQSVFCVTFFSFPSDHLTHFSI